MGQAAVIIVIVILIFFAFLADIQEKYFLVELVMNETLSDSDETEIQFKV